MVLWATILILQGASLVGSSTGIPGVPENITVMFLNPTSVRVSWSTSQVEQVEKYDVTYKPTDASYRVVAVVAGNSEAVTLSNLRADTQYQLVVTAVKSGKKLRSRPIVFRTLEPPRTSPQQDSAVTGGPLPPPPPSSAHQPQTYIQIRGVEVGIVVLVLIVWVGAIALFFNRWGKIRMLLPYQPDYKEQLKVPGTGVCASANAAYTHSSSQHACSQVTPRVTNIVARSRTHSSQGAALLHSEINAQQHLHWSNHHVDSVDSGGGGINWPKTTRPRVNSAIDVAGFLSQEFLRRHGSTSRLCRKVRSADNLPLASSNRQNSDPREDGSTDGDRETFLKSNQDDSEKSDDTDTRQNSLDNPKNEPSLIDSSSIQHQSSRDLTICGTASGSLGSSGGPVVSATAAILAGPIPQPMPSVAVSSQPQSSYAARRFAGWRAQAQAGREYARCPVRQPASVEERNPAHECPCRCYRRSCELSDQSARCSLPGGSTRPLVHHHHHHHHHKAPTVTTPVTAATTTTGVLESTRHTRSCEYARRTTEPELNQQQQQQQHFGLPILSVSEPSPPDEVDRADDYL
ncbi:uncharacterized protein LOC100679723 isoform X3 [Nasonia vitripennis]|uniref:Fibronectin type-III domain-containing protein n=1 Tax=Nasonia vitripennis TaxID=7425 RepID=A0A7M7QLY6_NASVI|nr:uncharacterized protein LOC100679723 isoform X3 [Nasonia vitripennis]